MNCETIRLLLSLQKPGSTPTTPETASDAAAVALHLTACPECRAISESQARFEAMLGKAMFAVPVPSRLGGSIAVALEARRAAMLRRRIWSGVGIAAGVLLVVGLSIPIVSEVTQPKRVDAATFVSHTILAESDPFHETRDWLESQGVTYMPASEFDLTLMTGHSLVDLQRRSVPMLRLRHPQKQVVARIYVLKSEDFDLKTLKPETLVAEYGV